jgi:hypothetical protein
MKLQIVAAAIVASAFSMPVFAQDKPVTVEPNADAPKAQTNSPSKRHSHLEEKLGIKPSDQPISLSKPVDKSKHFHPRDR